MYPVFRTYMNEVTLSREVGGRGEGSNKSPPHPNPHEVIHDPTLAHRGEWRALQATANVRRGFAHQQFRHAGMDCRHPGPQMRPDTSMSTWVPAVHAGTTAIVVFTQLRQI